jgi:hypothetical protein
MDQCFNVAIIIRAVMVKAVRAFEWEFYCETTWCYIPEGSKLCALKENLPPQLERFILLAWIESNVCICLSFRRCLVFRATVDMVCFCEVHGVESSILVLNAGFLFGASVNVLSMLQGSKDEVSKTIETGE